MMEKARKLSKLFNSLDRLNELLRRDYLTFLNRENTPLEGSHERYIENVTDRLKSELTAINRSARIMGVRDYQRVKPNIYILYLLFKYLRNQSNSLLEECKYELANLKDGINLDTARDLYLSENKSEEEAISLASRDVEDYDKEYQFVDNVLLKFLKRAKVIINDIYEDFSASNAFLLDGISTQALEIDGSTLRIGRLLQLSDDKFEKAITNAEHGNPEDGRYKKYKKPELTVEQVSILFYALLNTGGISASVKNAPLANHLEQITGYSLNSLSQGMSRFDELLNDHKRNRNAYNGYTVIEYLDKVKNWIDARIKK